MPSNLEIKIEKAINSWVAWLPLWRVDNTKIRRRMRICAKCTGSKVLSALALESDTPHQVRHALNIRIHQIIDDEVDNYIFNFLPLLHKELQHKENFKKLLSYNPKEGLDPAYIGLELDPVEPDDEPFLFTLESLGQQAVDEAKNKHKVPDLTPEEKQQLLKEINVANDAAEIIGNNILNILPRYRKLISENLEKFIKPQIEKLLNDLASHLEISPTDK